MAQTNTKRIVVYTITDLDTLNLSTLKDELQDDFHLIVGKEEATETLVNKRKFYQALEKNNIEHPETFFPEDLTSAKHIGKDLQYPVFLRPDITQHFSKVFGDLKGFVAKSYEELLKYYSLVESKKIEIMFQEIIVGSSENSFQLEGYFNKNFCSTGLFARQRLRIWPPDFGNTTLCVSIPVSRLAFENEKLTHFIKNINYNGLASAEYKKDQNDGKNKMLEINARPWYHLWLSSKCGINILFSSYLDAIGEKTECKQKEYKVGIKSIHLHYDMLTSRKMMQKGELTVPEWISSFKNVRQSALFDKNDPLPFFASGLKRLIKI